MKKLIKLSLDHFIVVDDSIDINENDITYKNGEIIEVSFLMQDNGDKITHSTKPIEGCKCNTVNWWHHTLSNSCKYEIEDHYNRAWMCELGTPHYKKIKPLNLSHCKEVTGEVDIEKQIQPLITKASYSNTINLLDYQKGCVEGYNQCLEINKDKKFTLEDIEKAIEMSRDESGLSDNSMSYDYSKEDIIQHFQKEQTEWAIEIGEQGKIVLL
jgi:hypothetical protein